MKNSIFMIAVAMLFSYLATSYMVAANANVEIGVESGDWMKYNIISDERNFTGWQKVDIYSVDGTFFRFNTTLYSDTFGYQYETGKYNMSEMDSHPVAYPDDTIEFIVIPADLKTGETFYYYNWGLTEIAGENAEIFDGAVRQTIYATYTPSSGMRAEASKIEYKWDKTTGILLEFLAYFPDGKTSSGKLFDTNIWYPKQDHNFSLTYVTAIVVILTVAVSILFIIRRRKSK
jgi:hypothetical protein